MDENIRMDFSCEPADEASASYHAAQSAEPQKPKKKHTTLKIVALLLVVALLGSVGGSALTAAIAGITHKDGQAEETMAADPALGDAEEDDSPFTLVTHALPSQLQSNDTGKSLTPAQVYEQNVNSVVGIQTETTTNIFGQEAVSASSGSGFILSEDGYIITNCHVISGADTIQVTNYSGDVYDAALVGSDSNYDIAVLKIDAEGLPAVTVGDSDSLKVGEEVVAIGNPLGELTFTMTNGILSALNREINTDGNPQNMIQTNAAINSGNSGGPLLDMDGNVIGVTTAKYSGSTSTGTTIEGLGFAIPINDALRVAYDLVEYGYVRGVAYLGVVVKTLDAQTASYYSLPVGPRVESVGQGSCAEKAGIQAGDIILNFNGVETGNNTELLSALRKVKAGETVKMTVYRAGAELELSVTLDERPREEDVNAALEEAQNQQENQNGTQGYESVVPDDPFGFSFGH